MHKKMTGIIPVKENRQSVIGMTSFRLSGEMPFWAQNLIHMNRKALKLLGCASTTEDKPPFVSKQHLK
jgi:hypothetical protein